MFERLFETFDARVRSGVVDVASFLGGVSVLASGERDERIRLIFEVFDRDSDGFISLAEMTTYLTSVYCVVELTSPELFASQRYVLGQRGGCSDLEASGLTQGRHSLNEQCDGARARRRDCASVL